MSELVSIGTVSLIRQGDHRFYSLTILSDVLAETCFIISRAEEPRVGFQRLLDKKRALEIANYIDSGLGTIPSAIVLSAQEAAELEYDSKRKSISFKKVPKAFLILDGQHRVYGFTLAKTAFRIPVVIYEGLSRRDESRLFIDINSKQKGVPPELLLDIKRLAEYEVGKDAFLRQIYDLFMEDSFSALYGKLSPASKVSGKISRTTFNSSVKPLIKIFGDKDPSDVYAIFNCYLVAFDEWILRKNKVHNQMFVSTVFKAIANFFPIVAVKVKDRFGAIYTADNFAYFLEGVGERVKTSKIVNPGNAYSPLVEHLKEALAIDFTL
jgi:DGQHR domain-containing protein